MKRKSIVLGLALVLLLSFTACGNKDANTQTTENAQTTGNTEKTTVTIGVSPTPHGEIVEALKPQFEEAGIDIKIVTFDDYVQPNLALSDGDLDLNYFQHQPYLDNFNEEHNLDLVSIGQVHIEPLALYSTKYKSVDEFPDGAEIVIPNDVTNGARALLLLEKEGLIELDDPTNPNVTEANITKNPKNFVFTPVAAEQVARSYIDVDGGVINANYALDAGINVAEDNLLIEGEDSPYANVVAVRAEDKDNETYKKVVEILNSDAAREFIETEYKGTIKPVF